jgi:hypothetical protein
VSRFSVHDWRRLRENRAGSVRLSYAVFFTIVTGVSFAVTYTANVFASEKFRAIAAALNRTSP